MLSIAMIAATLTADVASHVLFFIRGEWHLQGASIIRSYLTAFAFILLIKIHCGQAGVTCSTARGLLTLTVYCTSLYGSIVIYRIIFHPLRRVPGPPLAKVSKLWHTYHTLSSRNHLLLNSLYNQYGEFVRTG